MKAHPFQATHTPFKPPVSKVNSRPYVKDAGHAVSGQEYNLTGMGIYGRAGCKLDPGLKAPRFQNFNLMKEKFYFQLSNLKPDFLSSSPLQYGGGSVPLLSSREAALRGGAHLNPGAL